LGEVKAKTWPTLSDFAPCFVVSQHTVAKAHILVCFMCAVSLRPPWHGVLAVYV